MDRFIRLGDQIVEYRAGGPMDRSVGWYTLVIRLAGWWLGA